jgi:RNA polymerase sigma-70 factor (ECF subfamily)
MSFGAARLSGRMDEAGNLLQLELQDRCRWDQVLIKRGVEYLENASTGAEVTVYHLEAAIAAAHCAALSYAETDWAKILSYYDLLYRLRPSPNIALNRAIALGKACGLEEGLSALTNIQNSALLKDYPFYSAAQGKLHSVAGRSAEAAKHFEKALKLARSPSEKDFFERKLKACAVCAAKK